MSRVLPWPAAARSRRGVRPRRLRCTTARSVNLHGVVLTEGWYVDMTVPVPNVPNPDPSDLTVSMITREVASTRALLETRIAAVEKASDVFRENLTRVPTEVDKAIDRLRELVTLQVRSIETQISDMELRFKERATEMDTRLQQRFESSGVALAAASVAAEKAISAALSAADRSVQNALGAASAAVTKSDQSTEKRFETVDAIRLTLADAQTKLMPRIESEARLQSVAEKVADLSTRFENVVGRNAGHASSQATLITLLAIGVSVVIGMVSFFMSQKSQAYAPASPAAVAVVPINPPR